MSILASRTPPSEPDLRETVADRYGIEGDLSPLPGYHDRNFLLRAGDGRRWIVKVAPAGAPDDLLAFEAELLAWLEREGTSPAPGILPDRDGALVSRAAAPGGSERRIRLLEWLPGKLLADARPREDALLEDVGGALARLDLELAACPRTPPPRDDFDWALARAGDVMRRGAGLVDGPRRALLDGALAAFEAVAEAAAALPAQLVHGDLNDHNVLVSAAAASPRRVVGILDFGDLHEAPAVFDLAVAVAYALLGQADPPRAAARATAGYHALRPLGEEELDLVLPLARARLGASVATAAWRRREAPEGADPYLFVSEEPAWKALASLAAVPEAIGTGLVREACGLPPCRRHAAVARWLRTVDAVPAIERPAPEGGEGVAVLDLSVASPLLDGRDTDDTDAFTRRVFDAMAEAGSAVGIGRYGEPRGFYLTDAFAGRPAEPPERRTVHLGVDVFVPAGTPVRAPLPGRVVSVRDNAARLDYGPTVVLEHASPHGAVWTLHGHLERASVADLEPGRELAAGEAFARVGPRPENGDWPPHLHLQLILDPMGFQGDFPGVAAPRERAVWTSYCPDPSPLVGPGVDAGYREPDARALLERRRRVLGPKLSLAYAAPIHVVRGRGASLFDALGREYLDLVNNVAHVGHEHPRVVAALRRQAGVLNTNTRYLHESVVAYAERLADLLPEPLTVCYFVSSGSEANELALRLARAHTGGRGVVALEGGYHGNTQGTIDASHYKFAGPGGSGPPPWVEAVPAPDEYRGRYREDDADRATRYAGHVAEAFAHLRAGGHAPAAFLSEPLPSCAGQLVPPPGYLPAAYRLAREAGAVCIADEVQTGFGRAGTHAWGFEAQGALPDIVTLGKPMGNGHPIGAAIATPEIAASFAGGMEFFSTFGGNPVSAEVGLAVLDVIRDEALQGRALEVGGALKRGLAGLVERHPAAGHARGLGLFLGLEIVDDPETRAPDRAAARYVVERMKEKGVLLSTDGPDDNVLKIKPPMVLSREEAERVVQELDDVLGEDFVRERSGA